MVAVVACDPRLLIRIRRMRSESPTSRLGRHGWAVTLMKVFLPRKRMHTLYWMRPFANHRCLPDLDCGGLRPLRSPCEVMAKAGI